MIEVLWHGRGGQGAFTAARLLGAAATLSGLHYALAFPSFGPERRGAPMRAFTKVSREPIGDRSAIAQADYVVYLDGTLLPDNWADELKEGGICLVNASEAPSSDARLLALDADGISQEILGRPIPNTVFLGALAALESKRNGAVTCDDIEAAIRGYMPEKLHAKNIQIVQQVFEQVSKLDLNARAANAHDAVSEASFASAADSAAEAADSSSVVQAPRQAHSSAEHLPQLYATVPAVSEYAHTTCYTAGYLTQTNAGWRNKRPVVDDDKCTGCLQCYMVCPDGAIFKRQAENKTGVGVSFDLDFCKGCGVCANECKFGALSMANEQELLAAESEVNA